LRYMVVVDIYRYPLLVVKRWSLEGRARFPVMIMRNACDENLDCRGCNASSISVLDFCITISREMFQ